MMKMNMNELLDRINKEKRKKGRVKTAQNFAALLGVAVAIGAGVVTGILVASKSGKDLLEEMKNKVKNTARITKNKVQEKAKAVKNGEAHIADEVGYAIKDVDGEIESIKKKMKHGGQEIKRDIQETAENISNELNGEEKRGV